MQKESVKAFKNELRNYNYYLSRVVTLQNSIEWCFEQLGGVRGVDPSREPLHIQPNKEREWYLRDRIEALEAQKLIAERKVKEIDEILAKMETSLKTAIIAVYVNGYRSDRVAKDMFVSANGLLYRINKEIERVLDEV